MLLPYAAAALTALLQREALLVSFSFSENRGPVLALMRRYINLPMDLADACVVRMT